MRLALALMSVLAAAPAPAETVIGSLPARMPSAPLSSNSSIFLVSVTV